MRNVSQQNNAGMSPPRPSGNGGEGGSLLPTRQLDENEPVTEYDSKTVMIGGEKDDKIIVEEIVRRFSNDSYIPDEVTVIKRMETYYGPELFLRSKADGRTFNHTLHAPGPTAQLYLWNAKTRNNGQRRYGWELVAEIKAVFSSEQPPYERCQTCNELIRTVEHNRKALMGICAR